MNHGMMFRSEENYYWIYTAPIMQRPVLSDSQLLWAGSSEPNPYSATKWQSISNEQFLWVGSL